MYENMTYEAIMERMLARVPDTADKREGAVIYDALAPAAAEIVLMYMELDTILTETFADTAPREYLIRRAAERGITPYPASKAVVKASASPSSAEIAVGTRFSEGDCNYAVTEKVSAGVYKLQCETAGSSGNDISGTVVPIDYVEGLESISFTELLVPGEDEEGTEELRDRYFASLDIKAFGGNKQDYIEKTVAISGVGSVKVTPTWNGGGTVKLTILDSQYSKASNDLIALVQADIDPTQDGTGVGIAPIGHVVTVDTVAEVDIAVTATFTFQDGYTFEGQKTLVENAIKVYLLELRKEWADQSNTIVRVNRIVNAIMGVEGVIDVTGTEINGDSGNLELTTYQIPVFDSVTDNE